MYIRRVYYDPAGVVLDAYSMQGNFLYTPQDIDAQVRGLENWSCLEWQTPDAEFDRMVSENRTIAVNVETLELVWGEPGSALPPLPPYEPDPLDDAVAALETLGYEEDENGEVSEMG